MSIKKRSSFLTYFVFKGEKAIPFLKRKFASKFPGNQKLLHCFFEETQSCPSARPPLNAQSFIENLSFERTKGRNSSAVPVLYRLLNLPRFTSFYSHHPTPRIKFFIKLRKKCLIVFRGKMLFPNTCFLKTECVKENGCRVESFAKGTEFY